MKKDLFLSIGLSLILVFIINQNTTSKNYEKIEAPATPTEKNLNLKYGLPVDSFRVEAQQIARNEFLSQILARYGVEYADVMLIIEKSDTIFDVRSMKVGNKYTAFLSTDSVAKLHYFVYEQNLSDYVIFDFSQPQGVFVQHGTKPIETQLKSVSGKIESSLWEALTTNNINPLLANELSEIYAWSIDFFGLQKGDGFKAYYEEKFVEGQSIGFGKIYATRFDHSDTAHYAFLYQQDSTESYFDEQGHSLKKAFLKAPLKFSRISSHYQLRRYHPVDHVYKPHLGIDYAAPSGTPVRSIGEGTVIFKGYAGAAGHLIKIKHNAVYETLYMHLSRYATGLHTGKRVAQDEVIGYVGSTGKSTGPHLDFRVKMNGQYINPLNLKSPPVTPIKKENLKKYTDYIQKYQQILHDTPYPLATKKDSLLVADLEKQSRTEAPN